MTILSHGSPEMLAYLKLLHIPSIGLQTIRILQQRFESLSQVLDLDEKSLGKIIGEKKAYSICHAKPAADPHSIADAMFNKNVRLCVPEPASQDEPFCSINPKPVCLFLKGDCDLLESDTFRIAVVGTRHPTEYGILVTGEFTRDLVRAGCAIVSGLAFGIDTAAHSACISADGPTIAVIGSGILNIQPRTQTQLYSRILEANGLVISEFPPLASAQPGSYVLRNRIIAGISSATVVVEGSARSGALITARYAAEQGSEVFCIPSQITSQNSEAPHLLIKNGAHLAQSAQDILDIFQHKLPHSPALSPKAKAKQKLLTQLQSPHSLDTLSDALDIPKTTVMELLLELEVEGTITQLHHNLFVQRAKIGV